MKIKPLYRLFAIIIVFCCWLSTAVAQDENVTVTISNLPTTVQNAAFTVTITFSENVTGFATEDISLTGTATATVTDLTQGTDASIYTATITPTSDGTVIIAVDANAVMATDDADKNNSASDSHTVTVDVPPTVEITDVPTTVQNGAFTVKITFSETVSNFVATDITLGGTATATVTDLTKDTNVDTETYIATTTPTSDGTVTIEVPENVAQDTGNNDNTASAEETVTVDVPPTVVISNVPDIEKNEPFDITITFSEPVNGFQADDITLTGPATASIKTGTDGDSEYTATLTPNTDSEDDVKIKVPVGAAQDNGLNNNTASDEHIVHIDTIPPTVAITDIPDIEKNEPFDITITFSEPVNGFQVDDIEITGPATITLTSGTDGDAEYTATLTPNADAEGDVTFKVPADVAEDFAFNNNTESDEHTVHIDTIPPTVAITDVPDIEKNEPFNITITFSEPVKDFQVDSMLTGPATASIKTGVDGDDTYTATITPNTDSEDDVIIQLPVGAAQDFALNNNSESDEHTVHIDTIPPTVEIADVPDIEKNVPFDITITFSEPVKDFQVDSMLTGPATASIKTGVDGDDTYTATITPNTDSEDDVIIQLPVGAAQDFALNNNSESDEHTVHIDTIPPTVEIADVPDIEKNVPFDITITFSEPVKDFQVDSMLTGPATASIKTGVDGDDAYTVTITPNTDSEDDVIIQLPVGAAQDFALNNNSESDEHTVHIDTIPPTITITDVPDIEKNVPFDITITFSEPVNGFQADDIEITGPATISLTSGADGDEEYTATLTPNDDAEGEVTFKVPADTAQDFALNNNSESDEHTVHIDTIPPTVAITDVPDIEKNEPFNITITFSEPVNNFQIDDIELTGPTTVSLTSGTDGDAEYIATLTPNADAEGEVTFKVPADVAQDFALNNNTESDEHIVHIDTIPPTVAITDVPDIEKNAPFDITITFSEPVNDFQVDSILTGPATATLIDGSDGDTEYTATITPNTDAEDDVIIQVPVGAAEDFAFNNNTESDEHTVHIDTIPPTVAITNVPNIEKNEPFDITITFSEPINGFQIDDIELTGSATITLTSGSDGDSIYEATITPDEHAEEDVEFYVRADTAQDFALNDNTESTEHTVHVDTILPTVEIIDVPIEIQLEAFSVSIIFSEIVNDFEVDGIEITGDVVVNEVILSGGGSEYILTIIPNENTDGDLIIIVPEDVARDVAINPNTESLPQSVFVAPKWIPDPNIRIAVREGLGLDMGEDFAREQLEDLTELDGFYRDITDITGLEYAANLTSLELTGNSINDLTPLATLTTLTILMLSDNYISDITPLEDLMELTTLNLAANTIDDITALEGLTELTTLDLSENLISDLNPLAGLAALTHLYLTSNDIRDVSALANLKNLEVLHIKENPIQDTRPLVGLAKVIEADVEIIEEDVEVTEEDVEVTEEDTMVPPVLIPDPALAAVLRSTLDLDASTPITSTLLERLTTFQAASREITNVTGLEHATALTTLELSDNAIIDITPLQNLTELNTLNLGSNAITSITPLQDLTELNTLNLSNNPIGNLNPIQELTKLTTLELNGNAISNLNVLSKMTTLTVLSLGDNVITDITSLQNLTQLSTLNLGANTISDLNVLSELTGLTTLNLSTNAISNLIALAELKQLKVLNLNSNTVSNLTPLAGLTGLTTLILGNNAITSVAPITTLTQLKVLNLNNNSINDIRPLTPLTQLTTLNLTANNISDVAFLAGLLNLTTLRLAGNPILDTTALYPLTQRVPPVDIDIAVSQFPPWDVNADSSVNILDLVLVAAALGQSGDDIVNLRTDVNKDGSINILDLVLVAQHFGNNTADAPPSAELLTRLNPMTLASLDAATLETHLKVLLAESDGSLKYQRVIIFLQSLLAAIHPHKTRLLANYPNPFNPETWIPYALAKGSDVHILIYDTRGAVVRHLELGHQSAGYYTEKNRAAYWDGRNTLGERVASGIYFFQLRAVNVSLLRKMVILK